MLSEKAFTLIELLVALTIIGILAAIALPAFSEFKTRSYNTQAISNLRTVLTAQEAYYTNNSAYTNDLSILPGYTNNAEVTVELLSANVNSWSGRAFHARGDVTYCYNSSNPANFPAINGLNSACP
jgi:prepilin-type N-terminal cleavage/methylation domain-containing protein